MVRATQGHSIDGINTGLRSNIHGTRNDKVKMILESGLSRMGDPTRYSYDR